MARSMQDRVLQCTPEGSARAACLPRPMIRAYPQNMRLRLSGIVGHFPVHLIRLFQSAIRPTAEAKPRLLMPEIHGSSIVSALAQKRFLE